MGNGDDNEKIGEADVKGHYLGKPTNVLSRYTLQLYQLTKEEQVSVTEEGEDIELNLGLSLGGRFGVDKSFEKLCKSSSAASSLLAVRDDRDVSESEVALARVGLSRTSSLPVYSEFERWESRELHTLRRVDAKRRRSGKQRNLMGTKQGDGSDKNLKGILGNMSLKEQAGRENLLRLKSIAGKQIGSSGILEGEINVTMSEGNYAEVSSGEMVFRGSSEGSSSTSSDLESKILQVSSSELDSVKVLPFKERSKQDIGLSRTKAGESPCNTTGSLMPNPVRVDPSRPRGGETRENTIDRMPSVFTRGEGPNGKRVDGILYRYGEGEVSIMCVCHGNFHSPAEFVMHAGGACVDNPLKRIVINRNSISLL